jgi:UDP-N-acetylmuramyl pentapeptide phosphotransferase/UDP-N-acetylglucosamine-1-phosphate transferase
MGSLRPLAEPLLLALAGSLLLTPLFRGLAHRLGFVDHPAACKIHREPVALLIYLFSICHALTAALVTSVTLRLSLLALASSAAVMFIFGAVLRKAKA